MKIFDFSGTKRRRRSSGDVKYYVQMATFSTPNGQAYIRFVPYDVNHNYALTNNSKLCPKFENTDIRCVNKQDCAILESAKESCTPVRGETIGKEPEPGESGDDEPALYTYIVPIIAVLLLAIVIVFLLYKRRNRPIKVRKG